MTIYILLQIQENWSKILQNEIKTLNIFGDAYFASSGKVIKLTILHNSEDIASKLVVPLPEVQSFFVATINYFITSNNFCYSLLICRNGFEIEETMN